MGVNINEAIQRIRKAGASNCRAIPMTGQHVVSGNYQIEILENGSWVDVAIGIPKKLADEIISQATNRVIMG